jgi:2-polyprenyl-3-methyl-5-hydroxy-6-metoxy-1,4-benzoquinol methylase
MNSQEAQQTLSPAEKQLETAAVEKISFSFGRNWKEFLAGHLTPKSEQLALESVQKFLERDDLHGLSFLDVGCGSGLFSLAAWRLGARQITSFDVDPFSVHCCQYMRERAGNPAHWRIALGSVLDEKFLAGIEPADVVYAWGSLHHTGNMWQAIRNAGGLVRPGGLFYLAIYNRMEGRGSSEYWLKIKRLYNRSSPAGKRALEIFYFLRYTAVPDLLRLRNPVRTMREHFHNRGMSYWTDVRDWLGGYPYEFASANELFRFCSRQLDMELVNLRATNTTGTHELLFRRRS